MELFNTLVLLCLVLILYLYWRVKKIFSYFERHGIPYLKPTFPFGNMSDAILMRKSYSLIYRDLYNELAPHKFAGVFVAMKKVIMIRDPELVKNVLIRDFQYFCGKDVATDATGEPLSKDLFDMEGEKWKNLRTKLSTLFTSEKMKFMFSLVDKCGKDLSNLVNQSDFEESFDVERLTTTYIMKTVTACLFRTDVNGLDIPCSEFTRVGKQMFKSSYRTVIATLWPNILPKFIKKLQPTRFNARSTKRFADMVDKIVKSREENSSIRNDYLDLLIGLRNGTVVKQLEERGETRELEKFLARIGDKQIKSNVCMTDEILIAQCTLFFAAGFNPTKYVLNHVMLELAKNQNIQHKLRHEIKSILQKNGGQLTYEAMNEMTYMDMVIDETLRMYVVVLNRKTTKNYRIPDTEIIIPAGTAIVIPVLGIYNDPKYYDNPDEFRPQRFTKSEKSKRPHIPLFFGAGPKACIGERLAKMQMKIGLVYMLKDFSYRLSPQMKFPLKFANDFRPLKIEGGISLQRERV